MRFIPWIVGVLAMLFIAVLFKTLEIQRKQIEELLDKILELQLENAKLKTEISHLKLLRETVSRR
jgi:Tfp pilus assembly protein PilN